MALNDTRFKQTGLIGKYWPTKMILILGCFAAFITFMRENLMIRFEANVALNSLIIGTTIISFGMAFYNIAKIRWAAMFLGTLEKFEDNPSEEAAVQIIRKLRRKGKVINTFYMEGAILELHEPGYLKFTDNQSRIMKGKIGQRITRMRHSVQYFAGVLVMLGLIGTFWGLLETITSVGEAMTSIVDSFASSNGGGDNSSGSMVEFLKAISKPLQGMGIAFSASLFGLSGSLMTGLLNSFCAKGMDRFLEDFSNWVDARIPAPKQDVKAKPADPMEIVERHNQQVVRALEEALSGFAKQSQHMFAMFSELIGELTEFGTQQALLTKQLTAEKRETMRLASNFESGIHALATYLASMNESLVALPVITTEMRNDMRHMHHAISSTQSAIINHQQMTGDQMLEAARQQALLHNSLNQLFESNHTNVHVQARIAEALESLHGETATQKDKLIELLMSMQHILHTQINPAPTSFMNGTKALNVGE